MEENMNRTQDHQSPPHRRVKPPETAHNHQPPPPQKCPRCDSSNTKFCYYNNYSLSQPRYFCKGCRRYWTHGGTLRKVPIGGGCRKSKLAKISTASSSITEIARTTQALPVPTHPQIFAGMDPGQGSGMGNNYFHTGGTLFSSLAALQTLPAGINQPPPASLNPSAAAYGSGGGRFGSNLGLWQGMGLSSLRPQPPQQQYQANNGLIPSQHQSLIPMSSWSQGFVNRGGGAAGCNAGDGGDQVGSSFNISNQWSSDINNHQGFNPSQ